MRLPKGRCVVWKIPAWLALPVFCAQTVWGLGELSKNAANAVFPALIAAGM